MADKIKIIVKAKHIKEGKQLNGASCPIAHAVKEIWGGLCTVSVGERVIVRQHGIQCITYSLSQPAKQFIADFDRHGKKSVKPANFILTKVSDNAW